MSNQVNLRLSVTGGAQVSGELARVEGHLQSLSEGARRLGHYGAAALALPATLQATVGAFVRASDAVTTLNNQLRLATGSTAAAAGAYEALFEIAQRSRVSFTELGGTFASISRAVGELGISQERLLRVTEAIGNSMAIGGGSAQGMQAALVQLGQGFASGTLRGEELNSVMEQTPRLARAIADGMGISIGQLRALGNEGRLTAEAVFGALESQAQVLRDEMGSAVMTVAQSLTLLGNAAIKAAGEVDKASGATKAAAGFFAAAAKELGVFGDVIAATEKSGGGLVKTMANLAGAAIGRTLFHTVEGSAEALNSTINALTGNFFRLSESIDLMPRTLRSTAEQSALLAQQLAVAEREMAGLQARFKAGETNIYFRSQIGDLQRYIEHLRTAKAEQDKLLGPGGAGAGRGFVIPTTVGEAASKAAKEQAAAEAKVAEVRARLAGISPAYIKTLQDLAAAQAVLNLPTAEYTRLVQAVVSGNSKAAQPANQAATAYRNLADELGKLGAEQKARLASSGELTAAQQLELSLAQKLTEAKRLLKPELVAQLQLQADQLVATQRQIDAQGAAAAATRELERARQAAAASMAQQRQGGEQLLQSLRDQVIELTEGREALDRTINLRLEDAAAIHDQHAAMLELNGDAPAELEHHRTMARLLREQIAERKKIAAATASREAERANADAAGRALQEWQRASDQIGQALTDALMAGGKNAGEYIKGLFRAMVLRPMVQAVVNPIAGALTSALGFAQPAAAAGQAAGGFSNMVGMAGLAGSLGTFGTTFGMGASATMAGSSMAAFSGASSMIGAGNVAGGLGMGMGAAMPYVAAAMAIYAIAKSLDKSGTPHMGSVVGVNTAGQAATQYGDRWGISNNIDKTTDTALKALVTAGTGSLNALSKAFGGSADYAATARFASDATDPSIGQYLLTRGGQQAAAVGDPNDFKRYSKDRQAAMEAFAVDVARATRAAMDAVDLPAWARQQISALGDEATLEQTAQAAAAIVQMEGALQGLDTLLRDLGGTLQRLAGHGSDALYQLAELAGGVEALGATMGTYYQAFYSEAERAALSTAKVTEALAGVGLALPSSREAFRQVVEGLNLASEADRQRFVVLMQVAGAFDQFTTVAEASAKAALDAAAAADTARARQRDGLQEELLRLQGDTAALRELELAALDESNRALQQRIWALADEQARVQALAGAGQGIAEFIRSLTSGGAAGQPSLAAARAAYAADLALARQGDLQASGRMPETARTLVDQLRATATDPIALARQTSRIATELQALPATLSWQEQVLRELAQVTGNTAAGGPLAQAMGDALDEARATLVLTLDSALPEDLKNLALNITATVQRRVQFVADATGLPADLRTLALQTDRSLLVSVQAALAANLPADVRALALTAQHTLTTTVQAVLSASASADAKRLALQSTNAIVTTVSAALAAGLPDDVRKLALATAGEYTARVTAVMAAPVPDDIRRLALGTLTAHQVQVTAALGAAIPDDIRRLALTQASAHAVTVGAVLAATVADDVRRLALQGLSSHSVTVGAVLAAGVPADVQRLALSNGSAHQVLVTALMGAAIPDEVRRLALSGSNQVLATVNAVLSGNLSDEVRRLALAQQSQHLVTVQGIVSAALPQDLRTLLLQASSEASRAVILSASLASALTPDQRTLLEAVPADVQRVINQALVSDTLTAEQRLLLETAPATVRRVVEQLVQSPGLTDDQRALLRAVTGSSTVTLDVIVGSNTALRFDASDPLRSIFEGIRSAAESTAGLLAKASNGSIGLSVSLARNQNGEALRDIGWSIWNGASGGYEGGPFVRLWGLTPQAGKDLGWNAWSAIAGWGGPFPRVWAVDGPGGESGGTAGNTASEDIVTALRTEVGQLRDELAAGLGALVESTNRNTALMDRVTDGGNAMLTVAA